MFTIVKLDRERKAFVGYAAMKVFKATYGKSLFKVDFNKEDEDDIVPAFFYAALKNDDKDLTLERTIELIDQYLGIKGSGELLKKIMKDSGLEVEGANHTEVSETEDEGKNE